MDRSTAPPITDDDSVQPTGAHPQNRSDQALRAAEDCIPRVMHFEGDLNVEMLGRVAYHLTRAIVFSLRDIADALDENTEQVREAAKQINYLTLVRR